jgi:FkbM family methyltransferase
MKGKNGNRLYREVCKKGLCIKKAAEVGVFYPQASNLADFVEEGIPCLLVEPDPASLEKIEAAFGSKRNVTVYPLAVADENGKLDLVQRGACTFARNLPRSPTLVNEGYVIRLEDVFSAEAVTFDRIDPGDIDLLSLDVEGGEWFVIKHMQSRPKVIAVETHGDKYLNYYLKEINAWMRNHGYREWYKDESNTVYACRYQVAVTIIEKLAIQEFAARTAIRRIRGRIRKIMKNFLAKFRGGL